MIRNKSEEHVDISGRLRMIQQLEVPGMVAPRSPADTTTADSYPPLLDIEPHKGRMYVAGHEPHFRPVTLLQPVRVPRQAKHS